MFKKTIYIYGIVLMMFGTSLRTYAQDSDYLWAIKVSYGVLQYRGELNTDLLNTNNLSHGGGIAVSRFLNPSLDVTMGLNYNYLQFSGLINEVNYVASGHLISPEILFSYKFYNGYILSVTSKVKPYFGLGFSYLGGVSEGTSADLNGDTYRHVVDEIAFNMVPGVKFDITRRASIFFEADMLLATTDELDGTSSNRNNDRFIGARLGVVYKLGGPKDQDKDGVIDDEDECPDTPIGVQVDEKGCPLDRDKDGIPDYLDDCPDDPGLPEYNGCPDTDGDGIIDKEDDCPELPGLPEYNGCPDTDGDGVIDPNDLCPDTQIGVVVDEYGCPIDSDGDGLTDDIDQCPDEYGPPEYMGCPEPLDVGGWPEMSKDTPPEVYFETDKYELDGESEVELDKMVKYLFENPMMNIRLFGYADPRGTEQYNDVLSARRVEAVKKYLMRKGVPENRITVRALGEIQDVQTGEGTDDMTIDEKFKKARKVQFETYFFMR
ncbi:MAG: OmpA family protein [Prolixibacteraceae bacterium]|nr:OmpA family protein [Prolixibacteraceae bacterium]MBN2650127.1 OmpA family protein [Prolixibacteraceae bacterium]